MTITERIQNAERRIEELQLLIKYWKSSGANFVDSNDGLRLIKDSRTNDSASIAA